MKITRALGWLAGAGLVAGLVMGFGVAPREITQGNVQRIMYLHVPMAIVAEYLACSVILVASIVYLARRLDAADRQRRHRDPAERPHHRRPQSSRRNSNVSTPTTR